MSTPRILGEKDLWFNRSLFFPFPAWALDSRPSAWTAVQSLNSIADGP
ncbi:MAG: hypothetical protein Q7U53_17175 [Anaerolineaceae bacterium]|nr:hypothetical protein [Anaerolineaceae bacterium]